MGTTLTPAVEETVITTNHTVADIVKGLYTAEDTIEEGKELIRQGKRDLASFIALTPVLYEVSLGDVTVSGLLAMAGYQSESKEMPNYRDDQQLRYYLITGEVLSRLAQDKTKPTEVNTAVNRIAESNYQGFTKTVCMELINDLAEAGGSWGDFVNAVETYSKDKEVVKDDAAVARIVKRVKHLNAGQRAQLILALQAE